jgi:hypothetical protein
MRTANETILHEDEHRSSIALPVVPIKIPNTQTAQAEPVVGR